MKYWLTLCSLLLITLAACDTTPIDEPPPGGEEGEEETPPATCEGELLLQSTVPDTSHYANESVLTLELAFEQTASQAITYTVESSDAQVAQAEIVNEALRLQPRQIGETNITVTATDACNNTETMAFRFSVLDPCPPAQPEGTVDYFPLAVGQKWTFDYVMERLSSGGSEREMGTLRWEVTEEGACRAGKKTFTVAETFEGKEQSRLPTSSGPSDWEDVGPISKQTTLQFILGESLDLGPYSFHPIRRYYPPATQDTMTFRQDGSRQADSVCMTGSSGGPCFINLTLVRSAGLILRTFHNEISPDTFGSGRMERTD